MISQPTELNGLVATVKSKVIELEDNNGFSVQADYVNDNPAAVTFESRAKATLVIQDLTFTSVAFSEAANDITISFADTADAGDETVVVSGTAIVIGIESGASTATQVKAAYDATAAAVALATVAISGNAGDAQDAEVAAPLTGGVSTVLNLTAETIVIPAHGLVTGTKVAATTAGTLPAGLSATDYWVIKVDADTIKLASNLANATAGTAVNISGEGVGGDHTLTPATATGNVFKMQKSNDGVTFTDIASMTVTAATTTLSTWFEIANPTYRYIKLLYTPSAGQAALVTTVFQKLR
jgi:hypothetical protein